MNIQIIKIQELDDGTVLVDSMKDIIILNDYCRNDDEVLLFKLQQFYKYCVKYEIQDVSHPATSCVSGHENDVRVYIPAIISNTNGLCYVNNKKSSIIEIPSKGVTFFQIPDVPGLIRCKNIQNNCSIMKDSISQLHFLERKGNIKTPFLNEITSRIYSTILVYIWNTITGFRDTDDVIFGRVFASFVNIFDGFLSTGDTVSKYQNLKTKASSSGIFDLFINMIGFSVDTPRIDYMSRFSLSCLDIAILTNYCVDDDEFDCSHTFGNAEDKLEIMENIGYNAIFVDITTYTPLFNINDVQLEEKILTLYYLSLMVYDHVNGKVVPSLEITALIHFYGIKENPFSIPIDDIIEYQSVLSTKFTKLKEFVNSNKIKDIERLDLSRFPTNEKFPITHLKKYNVESYLTSRVKYPIYEQNDVNMQCSVGSGTYGHVCCVTIGEKYFACKKFASVMEEPYFSEISYLSELSGCDYILKVKGLVREKGIITRMLLEFATIDFNHAYLDDSMMFQNMADELITQLLVAVEYMHSRSISHSDIKPGNILWFGGQKILKMCDFGLSGSNFVVGIDNVRARTAFNYGCLPPEVIVAPGRYHTSGDMWCVGCMAYYFCTGKYLTLLKPKEPIENLIVSAKAAGTSGIEDNELLLKTFNKIPSYLEGKIPKGIDPKVIEETEYTVLCQKVMLGCVKMNPEARSRACDFIRATPIQTK